MLVLSRKNQESVVIRSPDGADDVIRIKVIRTCSGRVKLGFEAADGVTIDRAEVWEQRKAVDRTRCAQDGAATLKRGQMERWEDEGGEVKPDSPPSVPHEHFSKT